MPVDYDVMAEKGIPMGAGGFVIIDESTCIVDLVRYFMEFIRNESCGKCIPCREGTGRMLEILDSVIKKPISEDSGTTLERFKGVMQLETIASVMKDTSLCGLGQTAPNPFLSALENFREEFRGAHLRPQMQGKCMQGSSGHSPSMSINAQAAQHLHPNVRSMRFMEQGFSHSSSSRINVRDAEYATIFVSSVQ